MTEIRCYSLSSIILGWLILLTDLSVYIRNQESSMFSMLVEAVLPQECSWNFKENSPEVFWINLDRSKTRKVDMERHLDEVGLRHYRIRGLTPPEIYLPEDIESTWKTADCKFHTSWVAPNKLHSSFDYSLNKNSIGQSWNRYTSYMAALCGRGKMKNTPKELGCTTSHLFAMRQAIYSTTAKSRYALIVEDDVLFPFSIDFDELVKSAPPGFGILQIFNSNELSMARTWKQYLRNPEILWHNRNAIKFDYWSTCAYLIDRIAMKPVIDAMISYDKGWIKMHVIAGIKAPCAPRECCSADGNVFQQNASCVLAPRGYQADSFLYAMTNTYVLAIPIITNGLGGNQSTFHQDHVEMLHKRAFRQQREFVNYLYQQKSLPSFLQPACKTPLDVNAI